MKHNKAIPLLIASVAIASTAHATSDPHAACLTSMIGSCRQVQDAYEATKQGHKNSLHNCTSYTYYDSQGNPYDKDCLGEYESKMAGTDRWKNSRLDDIADSYRDCRVAAIETVKRLERERLQKELDRIRAEQERQRREAEGEPIKAETEHEKSDGYWPPRWPSPDRYPSPPQ